MKTRHYDHHDWINSIIRSIILSKDEATIQLNKIKIYSLPRVNCIWLLHIITLSYSFLIVCTYSIRFRKVIYLLYLRAVLQTTVAHSSDQSHSRRCTSRSACAQTPGWIPGRRKDALALRCRLKEKAIIFQIHLHNLLIAQCSSAWPLMLAKLASKISPQTS